MTTLKGLPLKKEVEFRLIKHLTFLESELKDYVMFRTLSWKEYNTQRSKRRDVERWIENIINSTIDISKIILTAEGVSLPDTYKEVVEQLSLISGFHKQDMKKISEWVRLKNIISHEYLDIRWNSIKGFIADTPPLFKRFSTWVKEYLQKRAEHIET